MNRSPKINDRDAALEYALRLLSQRNYSAAEMIRKLKSRSIPAPILQDVMDFLQERRYINNAVRCEQLFRKYCGTGNYSLAYIIQKLRFQHGFTDAEMKPLLDSFDISLEADWAVQLLRKKFKAMTDFDRNKGLQYLAAHGFNRTTAERALDIVTQEPSPDWTNLTPD